MNRRAGRRAVPAVWVVAAVLAACGEAPSDAYKIREPVTVEKGAAGPARVTLEARAAERLGIATVPIEEREGRKVVSSGAVIVDARGGRWVYVNEEPLVFRRHAIRIEREDLGLAWLTDGPPAGTRVVTLGAAELHGAETGIGK